jgi:hypothetical protein
VLAALASPASAAAPEQSSSEKIKVEVFVEAFCPGSAQLVSHELWSALNATDMAEVVELEFAQCGHCRPNATAATGFECQHGTA